MSAMDPMHSLVLETIVHLWDTYDMVPNPKEIADYMNRWEKYVDAADIRSFIEGMGLRVERSGQHRLVWDQKAITSLCKKYTIKEPKIRE